MKKVIKLTESELTALVKNVIKEVVGKEPIDTGEPIALYFFQFPEGKATPLNIFKSEKGTGYTQRELKQIVKEIASSLQMSGTLSVLEKYQQSGSIPPFIHVHAGTSHSGSGQANAAVAGTRIQFLEGLIIKAMDLLGVDSSIIKSTLEEKVIKKTC